MLLCFVIAACASPNVVLLSVDTLRPDHLGCYGYPLNTSPHIDRLAEQGLVFDDCVCEVPLTAPSFGSMLTSLYPRMTGTKRNGLSMPDTVPTAPELFHLAGYQTFCAQSNWTLKADRSRLNRGFDVYNDHFHKRRWGLIKPERYADEVTRIALDLLGKRDTNRPFFLWAHYSDPHAPYRFHKRFHPAKDPLWKLRKVERVCAKYDSELAYTDYYIGQLLAALPMENTYVLFVADHGESLYEHGYLGHGRRIYQAGVWIPLIVCGPGVRPGRAAAPARAIDVAPTLLGLAGLSAAPSMLGLDLFHSPVPSDRVRVIETYGGAVPTLPGARALMADRPPVRQGVVFNGWKLIIGGKRLELFSLHEDPLEQNNLAEQHPDHVKELCADIAKWDAETPKGKAEEADLTPSDVQALRSLGYLD